MNFPTIGKLVPRAMGRKRQGGSSAATKKGERDHFNPEYKSRSFSLLVPEPGVIKTYLELCCYSEQSMQFLIIKIKKKEITSIFVIVLYQNRILPCQTIM